MAVETGWCKLPRALVKGCVDSGLNCGDLAVFCVLLAHSDTETMTCYPSVSTIARCLGIKARAVQYHLGRLCERGVIVREDRRGKATRFTIAPQPLHVDAP